MLGYLAEELAALETQTLRRRLRTITQTDKAKLFIDGNSLLNFSSNNYLGLARHPQVIEAVKQVLEHWGVGATSSRLISGTSIIHQDLESAIAAFLNKEAALLFPTGYMANLGVITSLVGPGDAVVMDRLCHASLVDAVRLSGARLLVYAHADQDAAKKALERAQSFRRRLLVTESIFSMDGDIAPLSELSALAKQYEAISLVDEAHAIGIWGEGGKGLSADWDIVVGTLSKSLGSQGGFVAGSGELIETMINKARSFIFTTGLSPACVAAAQAALSLIQEDPPHTLAAPSPKKGEGRPSPALGEGDQSPGEGRRGRVHKLSARLRNGLYLQGWNTLNSESQIIPILMGEASETLKIAEHLHDAGIFAPAIRPPTVHSGECRIRFSVTADHTDSDIDSLLKALKGVRSPRAGQGGD